MDDKKKDSAIDKIKHIVNDRVVSNMKTNAGEMAAQTIGLAGGTALGIKMGLKGKKFSQLSEAAQKKLLTHSLTNHGLAGYAGASFTSGTAIPMARLKRMHNKEFGTDPDKEDYAKIVATKTLPSALYWGVLLKNRDKLKQGFKTFGEGAANLKKTPSLANAKPVVKSGLALGAGTQLLDQATSIPEYLATPETIVAAKKKKMEREGNKMERNAFEIVDEVFEKIASSETGITAMELIDDAYDRITGIEITAMDIVDAGYEKTAGIISKAKDVLTGKNIAKAEKAVRAAEGKSDVLNTIMNGADKIVDSAGESAEKNLQNAARNSGVKLDPHGNPIKTKHDNKDVADLQNELKGAKNKAKQLPSEANRHKADAENAINRVQGYKRPESSQQNNKLKAFFDNKIHGKQFKENKIYNSNVDKTVEKMTNGENIDKAHLESIKARETKWKKNKPVDLGFDNEVKQYNKANNAYGHATKNLKNTEKDIENMKSSLGARDQDFADTYDRTQGTRIFVDKKNQVKDLANNLNEMYTELGGKPFGSKSYDAAKSTYNKEVAKTVGAYGAIGGAGAIGINALNKKKDNQTADSSSGFSPKYDYNGQVKKAAEEIIYRDSIEKIANEINELMFLEQ